MESGKLISFHDIKADMGGKDGHNFTPEYMLAIDRASQIEAIEKGEMTDGNIIGFVEKSRLKNGTTNSIGDDEHIISLGDKSRNGANANQSSFTALTRGYLASMVGKRTDFDPATPLNTKEALEKAEKPYGRAQDYAGKEAKAAMANPYFYSRLSERFFEILRDIMPLDYKQMVENMYKGWKYWQEHGTTGVLPDPFSGNVSSQGMGASRYLVDTANGERRVGILAGDKCGPAGINRPIREGVYALGEALQNGTADIPDWIKDEAEQLKALQNGTASISIEDWIKKHLPGEMEAFQKGLISVKDLIEMGRKEQKYLLELLASLRKNGMVFEIWDAKAFDEHGNIAVNEIPESYADIADAVPELKDDAGQDDKAGQDFIKSSYKDGFLRGDLSAADKEKLAALIKKSGFVPTKRIFLDAQQDKAAVELYLADSDRFNIKQVWAKNKAGWDINNPQDYLDKPLLGSSVTKLGILAGGEYIGKDDPVMAGNIILMEHIYAFIKKDPALLQGDMNGSHWLAAIPTAFKYAVANKESHPILVGFRYTLSADGTKMVSAEDVFGNREYAPIRNKMFKFNFEFKKAQLGGQFEPYGTNRRTIEAAYPKNKLLKQLEDPRSPFLIRNMPPEKRKLRPITMVEATAELFKTATAASPIHTQESEASSAILSNPENLDSALKPGGIDFRVIPMITQPMGNFSGLNFSLPKLSSSSIANINLDEELNQIQNMLKAGITPSGERLKEYVAACYQKGELALHMDEIVASLVDICKLEEEKVDPTTNELKELMLILDSTG